MNSSLLLVICLLFAFQASCVDPSPDFNLTDFDGAWNIAGIFSQQNNGIAFYSCGFASVSVQNKLQVTFTTSNIDTRQNSFVQNIKSFISNTLNKAILISTTSPTKENNYVVTYYNTSAGEAIMINQAQTFGYVLSRTQNPLTNHLKERAENIFTSLSMSLNNATFLFNKNCDIHNLHPLASLDLSKLKGKFYGNAIYTTTEVLQNAACFTVSVTPSSQLLNLKANITYQAGRSVYTEAVYLSPKNTYSVYLNIQVRNVAPFVVIYNDVSSQTFVVANGDSTNAFVFSAQKTLPESILSQAKQALIENGMIPRGDNFYVLQTTCALNAGLEDVVENIFA